MRKLICALLWCAAFSAYAGNAPLNTVNCVMATSTPCTTTANPGNGSEGDPAWLAFGKLNAWGTQLGLFANDGANEVLATPSGAGGIPSLRALVGPDIPPINLAVTTNGGVTGLLGAANGGTGLSAVVANDCLAGNSGGTALQYVSCGTSGGAPGGTTGQVQYNAAGTFGGIASSGTVGEPLLDGGTGVAPTFGLLDLASGVTGTLPVANGGSGTTTPSLVAGTNITITGSWPDQTVTASGSGSMVYPGAGIPNSTGTAWGTSYAVSGTGSVALTTSPVFTTPNLGVPSAISLVNATALTLPIGAINATGTPSATTFLAGNGTWATPSASATSITPGTTTITGATAPCLIDNSSGTVMGCAAPGQGLTLSGSQLSTTQPERTVAGATDAINCTTDSGGIISYTGSVATAVSVPQAVGSCGSGFGFIAENDGTGIVTLTPTTSTIHGFTSLAVPPNMSCAVWSNGTNYNTASCRPLGVLAATLTSGISITPSCAYTTNVETSTAYTIAAPTQSAPTTAITGGTLATGTYYYEVAATTASGETTPDTQQTAADTGTVAAPTAGTASTATTGGTSLAASTTYYMVVTATTPNGQSTISAVESVTTGTGTTNTVTANWTDSVGATGYDVYLSTSTITAGEATVAYSTVASGVATLTFGAVPGTTQTTPAANTATTNTNANTIGWTAVTGASGYVVYRSTTSGNFTSATSYAVSGGSTATFTDTGAAGTTATPPTVNGSGNFTVNLPAGCTPYEGQRLLLRIISPSGGTFTYAANAGYLTGATTGAWPAASSAASKMDDFQLIYTGAAPTTGWILEAYNLGIQ